LLNLSLISVPNLNIIQATQLNVTLGGADQVFVQDSSLVSLQFQATDGARANNVVLEQTSSVTINAAADLGVVTVQSTGSMYTASGDGIVIVATGALGGLQASSAHSLPAVYIAASAVVGDVVMDSSSPSTTATPRLTTTPWRNSTTTIWYPRENTTILPRNITTRQPTTPTPTPHDAELQLEVPGVISGNVLINHISAVTLTASSIKGNLTIDSSIATVTFTATSAQLQSSLFVDAAGCSSVTLAGVYSVAGDVSWSCTDATNALVLPLSTVGGQLTVNARNISSPRLITVTGTVTGGYGGKWPVWTAPFLTTVGGLMFSGLGGGSLPNLLFPSLTRAGVVEFAVQESRANVQVGNLVVSEQLNATMEYSAAHLIVNGTINATGTVVIDIVTPTSVLTWNLTQGGDTTICDVIQEDPGLDSLTSVHNLTLGGCGRAIAPQTLRSLQVVLGTLRVDLPDASTTFRLPAFPSLRSIAKGMCLTSNNTKTVDLSPLLKSSVGGVCYIEQTIQLSSACPCREGCQSDDTSSCY
jgi:hypothetical protein